MELSLTEWKKELEEIILAAGGGDQAATTQLAVDLAEIPQPIPEDLKKIFTENLELIIENPKKILEREDLQQLVMALAQAGIDSMLVRDSLAEMFRAAHADYGDPAGLIRALGVLNETVDIGDVIVRREIFQMLAKKLVVWHDAFGLGHISDVDAFSDQIRCMFEHRQILTLVQGLTQLHAVKPGTLAATLSGRHLPRYALPKSPTDFDAAIAVSFIRPLAQPEKASEALLVPNYVTYKEYADWRKQAQQEKAAPKKKTGGKKSTGRSWKQARSLEELRNALKPLAQITADQDAIANTRKILLFAHKRPASAPLFAECLGMLWMLSKGAAWLRELISELPEETVAWQDGEVFIQVSCKLAVRLLPGWLHATTLHQDEDWVISAIPTLPHALWPHAETVMNEDNLDVQKLEDQVVEKFRSGDTSPDAILWLWRRKKPELLEIFSNAKTIFRTLLRPTKGPFNKARTEVLKLLLNDTAFQEALMGGGTPYGINNFIRTIHNVPLLDKGQQQSLLVKIVRQHPHALDQVENRSQGTKRRTMPKITSVRSYESRRRELELIINKKIPANSAAIAHARSYGDLRENAEYKAAKDEQRLLMARRGELEKGLSEVQPTDFADVAVSDTIIPGCTIELKVEGKKQTQFLLGLWDSDPEQKILSYDAPLGKALIGHKKGEKITVPPERDAEIIKISPLPDKILKWAHDLPPETE